MKEERKEELKDRLALAISDAGMRPIDLAEKTGIPKSMISYYLNGKTKPKSDRLYILAKALNVSEAWLLGFDVPRYRTDEQKKNDKLAELVVRMRNDIDFFETVSALADLNEKQYRGIKDLIAAFNE